MALDWQRWSEPGFHRALAAQRGRVLLMFGERGCGACRAAMSRIPALAVDHLDRLVYLDASDCGGLLREFGVFHLPALFLFRDGRFQATLEAPIDADLGSTIDRIYAAPARDEP